MSNQYSQQVAKLFRPKVDISFQTTIAEVIIPPPELTLKILNGGVILYPNMLYMNNRLFDDYTRDYQLVGEIDDITINTTSSNELSEPGPHSHPHKTILGKGEYSSKGIITNTDTLGKGDRVIVFPVEKGQTWIVGFKVRKVK